MNPVLARARITSPGISRWSEVRRTRRRKGNGQLRHYREGMVRRVDLVTLGLVALGGALGVLARAVALAPWTDSATLPWVTLAINACGTFLLGFLVASLGHRQARLRAFLGTGLLGGFTTYSALAIQTTELLTTTPSLAGVLVVGSLTTGIIGAVAGLFIGHRIFGARGRVEHPEGSE